MQLLPLFVEVPPSFKDSLNAHFRSRIMVECPDHILGPDNAGGGGAPTRNCRQVDNVLLDGLMQNVNRLFVLLRVAGARIKYVGERFPEGVWGGSHRHSLSLF
jgi:hypothetical protein